MKPRTVTVTEFKAKCLALLDEIARRGGSITVTKRGRPMAKVSPVAARSTPSPEGKWIGKVKITEEELMKDRSGSWDAIRNQRQRSI